MAKQRISIQWSNTSGSDYNASLDALNAYSPTPDIKATIRLKGAVPASVITEIMELSDDNGLELGITLTAEWDEGVKQLRLFAPDGSEWAEGLGEGKLDDLRDTLGT